MTTTYADLPRTPSGALTAASKRALADDEQARRVAMLEKSRLQRASMDAREELADTSDAYDIASERAYGAPDNEPQTDRERRIVQAALDAHEVDPNEMSEQEARELYGALAKTWGFSAGGVADQIYRMRYLGLDADKTALEVLDALNDAEAGA